MSKKYAELAQKIVRHVGGKENVKSVYHCATRLRFSLIDEDRADKEALLNVAGVSTVISSSGSYQVVIGPHVADVFEELEQLVDMHNEKKSSADSDKKHFQFYSGFHFRRLYAGYTGPVRSRYDQGGSRYSGRMRHRIDRIADLLSIEQCICGWNFLFSAADAGLYMCIEIEMQSDSGNRRRCYDAASELDRTGECRGGCQLL